MLHGEAGVGRTALLQYVIGTDGLAERARIEPLATGVQPKRSGGQFERH